MKRSDDEKRAESRKRTTAAGWLIMSSSGGFLLSALFSQFYPARGMDMERRRSGGGVL